MGIAKTTAGPIVRYQPHSGLHRALKSGVEARLAGLARKRSGGARIAAKSAVIALWFALSYVALVFFAQSIWQVIVAVLSLGLAMTGIGFCVQHDGGHKAFGRRAWTNRLAALSLDLVGASSYLWHYQHNLLHHHHPNIDGVDHDIEVRPLLRLADSQEWCSFHRFQQFYAWVLYAFVPLRWWLYDDFKYLALGRMGPLPIPRPKGRELIFFVAGKAIFFTWALVIPLTRHPPLTVFLLFCVVSGIMGVMISTVFQLAHCVEGTSFAVPPKESDRMSSSWAEHQLATTADFAPNNPLVSWYVGGLNYQVEHHLFPHVSHVHYSSIAQTVRAVCKEHGVPYLSFPTLSGVIASHFRFLRRLGQPPIGARAVAS